MPSGQRSGPEARDSAAGGPALPPPPPSASSFVASSRPLFLPPPPSPGPLPRSLSSCLAFLRRKRLIYYKCTFGADISEERRASADERSLRSARPERGPPHPLARLSLPRGAGSAPRAARAASAGRRAGPLPAAARAPIGPCRRPRTPCPRPRSAREFLHDCHKGKRRGPSGARSPPPPERGAQGWGVGGGTGAGRCGVRLLSSRSRWSSSGPRGPLKDGGGCRFGSHCGLDNIPPHRPNPRTAFLTLV